MSETNMISGDLWQVLIIIATVASTISAIVSVWAATIGRRYPPLPEEISKTYATKQELKDAVSNVSIQLAQEHAERVRLADKLDALRSETHELITDLRREISRSFEETNRFIGRLEESRRFVQ